MTAPTSERWRSGPWPSKADAERYIRALPAGKQAQMATLLGLELPVRPVLSPSVEIPASAQVIGCPISAETPGSLCLTLPWMPSLNHYWRHMILKTPKGPQIRVLISKEGREYRRAVLAHLRTLGNPSTPASARLAVSLMLYPPDRRRIDIDNRIKAGLDALTHAQVWADDSLIDHLTVQRGPVCKGGRVAVTITALDATLFEGEA